MNIKRCDRCGKEVPETTESKNVWEAITSAIKQLTEYQVEYRITKWVDGDCKTTMDLCSDCQEALKKWLRVTEPEERKKMETFIVAKAPDLGDMGEFKNDNTQE